MRACRLRTGLCTKSKINGHIRTGSGSDRLNTQLLARNNNSLLITHHLFYDSLALQLR